MHDYSFEAMAKKKNKLKKGFILAALLEEKRFIRVGAVLHISCADHAQYGTNQYDVASSYINSLQPVSSDSGRQGVIG